LVEADEEPPHEANPEALETVLLVALMLKAAPVREVHFMRKLVIDGSNTADFQRSALIAVDGGIDVDEKRIGIPTILLEEDAARKVSEAAGEVVYRLDRLGVQLVEVSTTPDVGSPEEAAKVALAIGSWLRATRRVLRGIGTIREDLNISIRGGARIEIKGVQELRMIPVYVEREVERQSMLLEVARALKERGVDRVVLEIRDLSTTVSGSASNVIRSAIDGGGKVLGAKLSGFGGLLRGKLGPEFAALAGVPEETRDPRPDGSSVYSRPLPGKARMYPETDVPPIRVTDAWLERLRKQLPEPPEAVVPRLVQRYAIPEQQARQLVQEGNWMRFEAISGKVRDARTVATTLTYTQGELRRDGLDVASLSDEHITALLSLVDAG